MVENVGTGNGDNTAYGAQLIVAVNDPSLVTDLTVNIDGTPTQLTGTFTEMGLPPLPCSGSTIPPHGVYPAWYVMLELGDIPAGHAVVIQANVLGDPGFEVHFDAVAQGTKQTGRSTKCYDVVNPSAHDVTVRLEAVEEPEAECPEISIRKTAPQTGVAVQETLDFTIEVANTGSCDLADVVVTDIIPTVDDGVGGAVAAFSVVTDPSTDLPVDNVVTLATIPTMASGDTALFTVSATFDQPLADGQEVENTACVVSTEMPEPECSEFEVAVGGEDEETGAGSAGFWCNRIRLVTEDKGNPTYSLDELLALLAVIDANSAVFSESIAALELAAAQQLLCGSHGSDAAGKLVRQLLALWLNVESGRLAGDQTLDGLCAGDEQLPGDFDLDLSLTTVADIIAAAEAALGPPTAGRATLLYWKDVIDFINNASLAVGGLCLEEDEPRPVRLRRSQRMPRH
jgi:uncharacterized repeat protein (TIGR01451 family)